MARTTWTRREEEEEEEEVEGEKNNNKKPATAAAEVATTTTTATTTAIRTVRQEQLPKFSVSSRPVQRRCPVTPRLPLLNAAATQYQCFNYNLFHVQTNSRDVLNIYGHIAARAPNTTYLHHVGLAIKYPEVTAEKSKAGA